MTVRHVLTIDLGTSGPKAAVVSTAGIVVGAARSSVRTTFGPGGAAEQDAEEVWTATADACRRALATATAGRSGRTSSGSPPGSTSDPSTSPTFGQAFDPTSIVAVVASAQYSSIVPVTADGRPVGPMVTWMDQRGSPKRLRRLDGYPRFGDPLRALADFLRIHGGAPIASGISLNHMRWLRFGAPEVYERAASLLEPVDYVTARLTGRCTANQCSAFMQMLADNRQVPSTGWHPDLVAASMIDPAKLPEAVPAGSTVGPVRPEVAESLGLPIGTPVLSGINDTQAGAIAAGAFTGSHAGLAVGTSSVIVTHHDRKKLNPVRSMYTMPSPLGGRHLLSAENGVAGVAVDHFLDQVVYPEDHFSTAHDLVAALDLDRYAAFNDAAAASPPGASGVLFLPWLRGSLAPKADGRARGGFLGVALGTTRNDLARAVLEGVALNLRWLQGPVEQFVGRKLTHHVFYGGGAGSDLWAQIMADVLDKPIHQLADGGFANSVGTAFFAFDRLGVADAAGLAARAPVRAIYEPDPTTRARYDHLAETFVEAFTKTRPLSARLTKRL